MGLQGPAKDPHKEMSGSSGRDSNRGSLLRESGTLTTILRLTPLVNVMELILMDRGSTEQTNFCCTQENK